MRARTLVPIAYLAAALLLLWPLTLHPNFVAFNPHTTNSDLLISHLPNAEYLRASLAKFGQVPLWNTALFAGQPFAADPLAGMWYPPNVLLLMPPGIPLPFAFNLLYALHLAWAGWGLYSFLRAEGLDLGPAFLGGLAFAGTPKLLAHLSAGHASLVWAVAWTPWLVLAVRSAARAGGLRRGALAGACLALIFLADARWAFFAALLGAAWWLALTLIGSQRVSRQTAREAGLPPSLPSDSIRRHESAATIRTPRHPPASAPSVMLFMGVSSCPRKRASIAAGLDPRFRGGDGLAPTWRASASAPSVMLSAAKHLSRNMDTKRAERRASTDVEVRVLRRPQSTRDAQDASRPPGAQGDSARKWGKTLALLGFVAMAAALSAVLALPLAEFTLQTHRAQLTLPEAGAYSLPPQYLAGLLMLDPYGFQEYLTYLGLAPLVLALGGLRRQTLFWIVAAVVAAIFSLGVNAFLFPLLFQALPGLSLLRVPSRAWFIVALSVCVLAAYGAQRLQRGPLAWQRGILGLLVALTLFDLVRVSTALIEARPRPESSPAARWLAAQPGLFRVYSPSYSLPPGDGLQHVDGVDPLQLAAFSDFFQTASGVPVTCYSVTLPPLGPCIPKYADANPAQINAAAVPDAFRLGLLNVKFVAAEFPIDAPGFALVQTFGDTRVYENTLARPRAWVDTARDLLPAEVVEYSPNRIRVRASGTGQLVLSEALYPGWRAQVDGVETPIALVEGLLRGVSLGPGAHEVVMEYRPAWLYLGAAISALGLLALVAVWRWAR